MTGNISKTSTNKIFPFLYCYLSVSFFFFLPYLLLSPLSLCFSFLSYPHLFYSSLLIVYPFPLLFLFSFFCSSLLFFFPSFDIFYSPSFFFLLPSFFSPHSSFIMLLTVFVILIFLNCCPSSASITSFLSPCPQL